MQCEENYNISRSEDTLSQAWLLDTAGLISISWYPI